MASSHPGPGRRSLDTVTVGEAMHHGLIACPADEPLTTVARKMGDAAVHCILIAPDPESGGSEWRVVSDLDLMGGVEMSGLPAGRLAASPLVTVSEGDSVLRAARLMHEHQAAHLLVLSDEGPSGVISTLDVARVIAGSASDAEGISP